MARKITAAPMISKSPRTSPNNANESKAVIGMTLEYTMLQIKPAMPSPHDSNSKHPMIMVSRYNVIKIPANTAATMGRIGKEVTESVVGPSVKAIKRIVTAVKHGICKQRMFDQWT